MPKSSIPFLPKSCEISEKHKIYWISSSELIQDIDIYCFKAPFSDTFYLKVRNIIA